MTSYDTWKSTEPDDLDWMECDCCGRRCSRLHCTIAYGTDTSCCDDCFQYDYEAYGEEPDHILEASYAASETPHH